MDNFEQSSIVKFLLLLLLLSLRCVDLNGWLIFFCWQLRVVRAFKSTLEDLEEKRSIHSFHSLHSIRSSRSHPGPRPISEEAYHHDHHLRSSPPENIYLNTPEIVSTPISPLDHQPFKAKSQSFENVPLVAKQPSPILAPVNQARKKSPTKTFSQSDIANTNIHETSI